MFFEPRNHINLGAQAKMHSVEKMFATALVFSLFIFMAQGVSAQNDSAFTVEEEFSRELKLVEGLKVYNAQLEEQLGAQDQAKTDIQQSIADAATLNPQVSLLMKKMIVALETFIASDLPFRIDERTESVRRLQDLMSDAAVSDSERFRQVLDIYTIETEYGQSFEAYSDQLNDQPVDILRIGRLSLYAQTKDQGTSFVYNKASNQWEELDGAINRDIRKAIKVAAKTTAPELLSLPIPSPSQR